MAIDTQETNSAVPVVALLASTSCSSPDLASSASCGLAETICKDSSIWADTLVSLGVEVGASSADSSSHTEGPVPERTRRTLTVESIHVPFLSVQTWVEFSAGEAIPSCTRRALAHLGVGVVDSA